MKKFKHTFIKKERLLSDAFFHLSTKYDGVISFQTTIDNKLYRNYLEFKFENYYSKLRELVKVKHSTLKKYSSIK